MDDRDPTAHAGVPSSERDLAVVAEAVTRDFESRQGHVKALGPASLEIHDGQFVCLVGPSGCGKSTLLRMVAGLIRPTTGAMRVVGSDGAPDVGIVFQDYSIFPWKTVEQNIRLGLELKGMSRAEANERVAHWARRLKLEDFLGAYPHQLSGGMRQRVAIARAMVVNPRVLLMDEPFAALDAQLRTILQNELLEVWEAERRTVLFVTHSLDEAVLLGDRVVVMSARPGVILADREVALPRPRDGATRSSPEFAALRDELWELLRGQVQAAQR